LKDWQTHNVNRKLAYLTIQLRWAKNAGNQSMIVDHLAKLGRKKEFHRDLCKLWQFFGFFFFFYYFNLKSKCVKNWLKLFFQSQGKNVQFSSNLDIFCIRCFVLSLIYRRSMTYKTINIILKNPQVQASSRLYGQLYVYRIH
jgi:hypothetical protein